MPETVITRHDTLPGERIAMPAPTAWPMTLALAVTLCLAGMVTSGWVTAVGQRGIVAALALRWLEEADGGGGGVVAQIEDVGREIGRLGFVDGGAA